MTESQQALFSLSDRVAIVTGASSGLGARFCRCLASAGATVYAAARRSAPLELLANEDERIKPAVCDVTSDSDRLDLISHVVDLHGSIDVLVNNAGVAHGTPVDGESSDDMRSLLDVNVIAPIALAQEVAKIGRPSSIINISSIRSIVAVPQVPAASYSASKGAIAAATREQAAQWGHLGIRVNAIAPGWFQTEMTGSELFTGESGAKWLRQRTPLVRQGTLEDLDGTLIYLASDASSFVTGQVIFVDGGWTII